MPRRPNTVSQSEVRRNIRAAVDANLSISRIVVRPDGVVTIETTKATETESIEEPPVEAKTIVL